jgi:hypothetical protein
MKKQLLTVFLLLIMSFGMIACAKPNQQTDASSLDDLSFSDTKQNDSDVPPLLPDGATIDIPQGVVNPANIYESSSSVVSDGFIYSGLKLVAKSSALPAGVSADDIYYSNETVGADGQLSTGNKYYFVSITITNESNEANELYLDSSFIAVLDSDNNEVARSEELRYAASEGQKPNDHSKKDFARAVLSANESRTFTLGYIMSDADVSKGETIFVVGSTGATDLSATYLDYQAFRMG